MLEAVAFGKVDSTSFDSTGLGVACSFDDTSITSADGVTVDATTTGLEGSGKDYDDDGAGVPQSTGACETSAIGFVIEIALAPSLLASSRAYSRSFSIFALSASSSAAVILDYSSSAFSLAARAASFSFRAFSFSICYSFCYSIRAFSSFSFCSRSIF